MLLQKKHKQNHIFNSTQTVPRDFFLFIHFLWIFSKNKKSVLALERMLLVASDHICGEITYGLGYYVLGKPQEDSNGKVKGGLCCDNITLSRPIPFSDFLLRDNHV